MKTLNVPNEVLEMEDADEIVRVWIGEGDSVVTLHDLFGDDLGAWGMVIADIAVHIARMRSLNGAISEIETLKAIEQGYRGRLAEFHQLEHRSLSANN
ncbi:DUF5076 domain-containing protein [Rhizobium sp. BK376]|uniref:DUF5076 domain-containing protein n=1 Tax=Rhizobium sp. BK376 TaxID=2512149 RepID=UPI00104CACE7|nr:DUF5076 domain-containing protein [Rhizobium sp. BK376]TCR85407.1 uncharacterized protein DUF5076 [Rhizobium sp. BK376]